MKVILKASVKGIGGIGDEVNVSDGYARNFLFPKALAVPATDKNVAQLDHEKKLLELKQNKEIKSAKELSHKIKKISCTIARQVGENEKLFGSVTTLDIVKCLQNEGITVDKKQVILEDPIKTLGIYSVLIRLHPEVETRLKVWVVKA